MISCRIATETDFAFVYACINQLEDAVFDRVTQEKIFKTNLQNPLITSLLATDSEKPVGFVSCHAQWLMHHSGLIGEIQEMFVIETHRSKGVGKILMDELVKICRSKNILQLEVTSNRLREDAHRFYLKERFKDSHKKFTRNLHE